ncbi:MAG: formylglycine-generating enzyme family protein [Nitrospirae bacterium]|nr:MAG: formylglycine-generating enzyme family protein [Nitrospirota bacterium]
MKDKWLTIGIIATFGAFFLMIVSMMTLSRHSAKNKELLARAPSTPQQTVSTATADLSLYKTIVGDDGREMVEIPEGPFKMGSNNGDYDEAPEHQVYLATFYIDKYEVTQAEYDRFVKATKRGKPFVPVFDDDISKILKPELAAMGMSWSDAAAYCQWAGKRLPTEAEWEKAAKGEGNRQYPWGDTLTPMHANLDGEEDGYKYLAPPGKFEAGRSPYGLYDMAGNVAEWVHDTYDDKYYSKSPYRDPKGPEDGQNKVIRGGSWRESPNGARVSKRFQAKLWRTDATIGFRCAKGGP